MVEHDFYKLMQLQPYAGIGVIKKRYYELAQLYHPDKNPKNKDAGEYFKIITQGYNILSDADKKMVYDDLLRQYYERSPAPKITTRNSRDISERLFQNREKRRKYIIADYLEAENNLSHNKRLVLAIMVALTGFVITFKHWFINYLELDTIYNFAGFLICYTGCYFIANNIYRRDAYKNAINIRKAPSEKRAVAVFLSLFFTLPLIFWMLVTTSARLQLSYFSDYTTVRNIMPQYPDIYYEYRVDNRTIKRHSNIYINTSALQYRQIRVKYSRLNPNISELVILD